jgi:hypothetical protein
VLVVLRLACEDRTGWPFAARIVPLLVQLRETSGRRSPEVLNRMIGALEPQLIAASAAATEGWLTEARRVMEAFWRQRVQREQSIVRLLGAGCDRELQPGLFDRRAERAQSSREQEIIELITDAEHRIQVFLRRAVAARAEIQAALVLS